MIRSDKTESITSLYSGISIGTERLIANGKVPKELYDSMKIPYQEGDFNFPIKYGYSVVGKTSTNNFVHLMHPHQQEIECLPQDLYYLPKKMDLILGTQISNMETVINAIWMSKPQLGDKILVCGFGSIGGLLTITLKNMGFEVFMLEKNPIKEQIFLSLDIGKYDAQTKYDMCYNTTANTAVLNKCIKSLMPEGKIIELSWYGNTQIKLNLGGLFHTKRLQIQAVQVSEIPNCVKHKHNYLTRKKLAIDLLTASNNYKKLITNIIPFENLPSHFDLIRNGKNLNDIITIVKY